MRQISPFVTCGDIFPQRGESRPSRSSTGFAQGGATVEDVKLFREHISPDMRIKAAGGIRTFEQAQAMLDAGADRIGASALVALYQKNG